MSIPNRQLPTPKAGLVEKLTLGVGGCESGVIVFVLLTSTVFAQQPSTQTPRLAVTATTVVVDVIVRDRNGRPVMDLAPQDFEVFEDGVRHELTSVQAISSEAQTQAARTAEATPEPSTTSRAAVATAPPGPAVVALVFDRLSPDARSIALKGALTYVDEGPAVGDFTGVFTIDTSLRTIQGYTRDAALVRRAVDRAASAASSGLPSASDRSRSAEEARALAYGSPATGEIAAAESAGRGAATAEGTRPAGQEGGAAGAGSAIERRMAEFVVAMDEAFVALSRDQQGYATTNGLLAVVHSLQGMPGRKTLVFFSEGVAIPAAVEHHFQSVIDVANRANVAIYTLDASGLRVRSNLTEARAKMADNMSAIEGNRANGIMTKGMELSEDTMRSIPRSSLGRLAQDTGGLFFENSNDLRGGMRRIDSDRHFYYLLGYVPKNERFDGQFRNITVKVRRPGVEVRARKGYSAVKSSGAVPVLSFEAPGVAVLDSGQAPNAFPVQAAALTFPEARRPGLTPVLVRIPADAIAYREDAAKKRYAADLSVVVRLKNANDQVVRKLSQRYEIGGPLDQLEKAKQGDVLFYREPELPAGVYTLETAVHDAIAGKTSARFSTVEVTPRDVSALGVSTLMIVSRSERVPASEKNAANPLYNGDVVLYPNLGDPLRKARDQELTFAATIYAAAAGSRPQATLELLQNGAALAQAPVQLPAADAQGRIQYVGRLPIETLSPGRYELRLTVSDAKTRQTRTALVRIE